MPSIQWNEIGCADAEYQSVTEPLKIPDLQNLIVLEDDNQFQSCKSRVVKFVMDSTDGCQRYFSVEHLKFLNSTLLKQLSNSYRMCFET